MNKHIRDLLARMADLETELQAALHRQETQALYKITGTKVRFNRKIRGAHRQLKMSLLRWFRTSRPQNIVSAPIIYGMIIPLVFLDVGMAIYQRICFPLYGMSRVRRSKFIVVDRHRLAYLNSMEKLNCAYCGYANGLIALAREIIARTEQYWCPIKHARKVIGSHARYAAFLDFGGAQGYQDRLEEYRGALAKESEPRVSP